MFRERYSSSQTELFNVLTAVAAYVKQVGYCQGMSHCAALLLMYLNCDEDTFFALGQVLVSTKHNLKLFFMPTFPKLETFQCLLDKVSISFQSVTALL